MRCGYEHMNNGKVAFKSYTIAQPGLTLSSWDELTKSGQLARVVNRIIGQIEIKCWRKSIKAAGPAASSANDAESNCAYDLPYLFINRFTSSWGRALAST